ncbi:MAG: molybdopterin-guanine dinucleotide biosynthesis protein B [Alphaproteobacteria bacterium]|nr:molybdopterin-guanine dinucleotide biosynthesis protein B [Alphaproteobacteria bacterium]
MKVFGLAGYSGTGKTTLLVRLLPELTRRGYRVSTIKHAHHTFDVDTPGKDSYEHRAAGAHEVMVASSNRWALMHENRGAAEPKLEDLLARLAAVDLVLIEGFKRDGHDKIEIVRGPDAPPVLWRDDPHIVAIASDHPVAVPLPQFRVDDIAAIADFIVTHSRLADRNSR